MYKKAKGRVRLNGRESNTFEWTKGLKQGDSLSPLLFNLIMDQITKDSNNELRQKKTNIGYYHLQPIYVQALTYADDVVLIGDTEEKLQQIVTTWAKNLEKKNLKINAEKCKHITKGKEQERRPNIMIGSKELECVEQFKYLGTIFTKKRKN